MRKDHIKGATWIQAVVKGNPIIKYTPNPRSKWKWYLCYGVYRLIWFYRTRVDLLLQKWRISPDAIWIDELTITPTTPWAK